MAEEQTMMGGLPEDTEISKEAQDVAKATGTAYSDIAAAQTTEDEEGNLKSYGDITGYDAAAASTQMSDEVEIESGLSFVDPQKSTVAGQLTTLLSGDSKYIQNARQRGREQAQARGMLNTSMSAGAAERSAIEAGAPIAQQDAQTYAQAQQIEQQQKGQLQTMQGEAIVSGEIVKQKAQIDRKNQSVQNAFQAQIQGASGEQQAWMQGLQNNFNEGMKTLEFEQNKILQGLDISAKRAADVRLQTGQLMQNYQISVENIMTDPDFLLLGADGINNALNQLQDLTRNSIGFIGASADMGNDFEGYIDLYMEDLDFISDTANLPQPEAT